MKTFYNTINLQGADLKKAVQQAHDQDEAVLLIFQNSDRSYSPSQILGLIQKTGKNPPITSIRRSITNLTTAKKLVKTEEMTMGMFGKPEHRWRRV